MPYKKYICTRFEFHIKAYVRNRRTRSVGRGERGSTLMRHVDIVEIIDFNATLKSQGRCN